MLSGVARLSNQELIARVTHLAAREREATASLITHLAELDKRRAYLAEGCSSLFTYCTQILHLSEHAAYGRIEAARAVRRFPVILERLSEGSVTLTTVGLLASHLTPENHRALLDTARHTSKRQVEALVARLRPQPPVPASVRKLPTVSQASASATALPGAASTPRQTGDAQASHLHPCRLRHPRRLPRVRASSPRWPPSATRCSSRRAPRRTRSCGSRRPSCATRSRTEIWGRSSIGR